MWPWLWPWPWTRPCKVKDFEKFKFRITISSSISVKRSWSTDSRDVILLPVRRQWTSQWRHKWRQNHIIDHSFGSNCLRPFVLSSHESLFKGASNVTLTFDVDLDQGRARLNMSKISNFAERYWVVCQIKGIDYLISEIYFFCPHNFVSSSCRRENQNSWFDTNQS